MNIAMEIITDNMYKKCIDRHNKVLISTHNMLNSRNQLLLIDFDLYSKTMDFRNSIFYLHIDSLPDYCSNRLKEFKDEIPVCIKHLDLFVLTSV